MQAYPAGAHARGYRGNYVEANAVAVAHCDASDVTITRDIAGSVTRDIAGSIAGGFTVTSGILK